MCVSACECVRGVGGRHEAGRRGGGGGVETREKKR